MKSNKIKALVRLQKLPSVKQLVINWHLTEACNYGCRYCYSAWDKLHKENEIIHNSHISSSLLYELSTFFNPANTSNPLYTNFKWDEVRLSLAGGEALLYPQQVMHIAKEAQNLGFKLSLITNGSLLNHQTTAKLLSMLSMLGISLDSASSVKNQLIGRSTRSGHSLELNGLFKTIQQAREVNPDLIIKVNTVVNSFNVDENLSPLIECLQPDKWKILRVLPVVSTETAVSDQQFSSFVKRHQHFGSILTTEDNQDMIESYLMIDPFGRFFQNCPVTSEDNSYLYSQPIFDVGAEKAFSQINFDSRKFVSRYSTSGIEELYEI